MARTFLAGLAWVRRILSFEFLPFSENVNLGLLALALSASLWIFITNEQNPPRTGTFQSRIAVHPVNVPPALAAIDDIEPVIVQITAPSDLWSSLTEASFDATVDMSESSEGSATRIVRVQPRDARVRVLQVIPSTVTVEMDLLQRRTVPVQVNLSQGPPLGFSNQQPRVEPQQAVVVGPQRLVNLVETAVVKVNLSNTRTNLRQSLPLEPEAGQGTAVEGVRLEPAQATVDIAITRHVNFVSMSVVADFTGAPANGYWVSQVRTTPSTVTAVGPQDVLQPLGYLKTLPIDLSGASSSFSRRLSVTLPQGVTLSDRVDIQVDVTIQPLQSSAVFQVAPQFTSVAQGLRARSNRPSIAVTVTGDAPLLRDLAPDAIRLVVNVEGKAQGTYSVAPLVNLPAGLRVLKLDPEFIQVTLE